MRVYLGIAAISTPPDEVSTKPSRGSTGQVLREWRNRSRCEIHMSLAGGQAPLPRTMTSRPDEYTRVLRGGVRAGGGKYALSEIKLTGSVEGLLDISVDED